MKSLKGGEDRGPYHGNTRHKPINFGPMEETKGGFSITLLPSQMKEATGPTLAPAKPLPNAYKLVEGKHIKKVETQSAPIPEASLSAFAKIPFLMLKSQCKAVHCANYNSIYRAAFLEALRIGKLPKGTYYRIASIEFRINYITELGSEVVLVGSAASLGTIILAFLKISP